MIYTLNNDNLTVSVNGLGAELTSVKKEGVEYLWQGDPKYWKGQSPILFPICGRLFNGKYVCNGKEYEMTIHGFARHSEFSLKALNGTSLSLTLSSSEKTKEIYPFDFKLTVTYSLENNALKVEFSVTNTGKDVLPFSIGAHPGFNVPFSCGDFSDYYLEFAKPVTPKQVLLSKNCLDTGKTADYPLTNGNKIPLTHELFANDGIFLTEDAKRVSIKTKLSDKSVTVTYDGFKYLGLWQPYGQDTPFLCIEPWLGLPSYDGVTDDFSSKHETLKLESGKTTVKSYVIEING